MSPTYQDEWRREGPRPQTQKKKKKFSKHARMLARDFEEFKRLGLFGE